MHTWPIISRKEWVGVAILCVFIVLAISLPFWYGKHVTTDHTVFVGTRTNNSKDFPSYLAWIEQARQGHMLFKDLYSSEEQPRTLFNPLFLLIGLIGNIIGYSNVLLYHVFRILCSILLLCVGYIFVSLFTDSVRLRAASFFLFGMGAGLGWVVGIPSVDIIQSEGTNFLTMYESLINTTSLLLILSIFTLFLTTESLKDIKKISGIMLLANLLVLIHGYDIVMVLLITGAYTAIYTYQHWRLLLWCYLAIGSLPAILWQLYTLNSNQALGVWATIQTRVPAQKPLAYLATYGILLALSVAGAILSDTQKKAKPRFLILWEGILIFLLFNPFSHRFQQKLSLGIFVPLSVLSSYALSLTIPEAGPRHKRLIKYSIVYLVMLPFIYTNIYVVARDIHTFNIHNERIYISREQHDGLTWIKTNSNENNTILAGTKMSNLIPGFTGRTVYFGHYDQTIDFNGKLEASKKMLASKIIYSDPLRTFLKENKISYIVEDSEIRSWGEISTVGRNYLNLVYSNSDIRIYKITSL